MFDITVNSHGKLTNMPKFRSFEKLYKELNITHEEETPSIPSSALPSNNLQPADHSLCDFIFEGFVDKKGRLMWKGNVYRLSDDDLKKFRECLMQDLKNMSE